MYPLVILLFVILFICFFIILFNKLQGANALSLFPVWNEYQTRRRPLKKPIRFSLFATLRENFSTRRVNLQHARVWIPARGACLGRDDDWGLATRSQTTVIPEERSGIRDPAAPPGEKEPGLDEA
jgi:hypothetical protein